MRTHPHLTWFLKQLSPTLVVCTRAFISQNKQFSLKISSLDHQVTNALGDSHGPRRCRVSFSRNPPTGNGVVSGVHESCLRTGTHKQRIFAVFDLHLGVPFYLFLGCFLVLLMSYEPPTWLACVAHAAALINGSPAARLNSRFASLIVKEGTPRR